MEEKFRCVKDGEVATPLVRDKEKWLAKGWVEETELEPVEEEKLAEKEDSDVNVYQR